MLAGGLAGPSPTRVGDGNDAYVANDIVVNGGAFGFAHAALVDVAGNNSYKAGAQSVNGGGEGGTGPAVGMLADLAGTDSYEEDATGIRTDCTVVPKGTGAQIDGSSATC